MSSFKESTIICDVCKRKTSVSDFSHNRLKLHICAEINRYSCWDFFSLKCYMLKMCTVEVCLLFHGMVWFKVEHLKRKPQAIAGAARCSGQGHTKRGSCGVHIRPWLCEASGECQEVAWKSITIWFILASRILTAITLYWYDSYHEMKFDNCQNTCQINLSVWGV